VAPFDVILAKVRVGESFKVRFCVVLESLPDGSARVLPCSSSFEHCTDGVDFEIHDYCDEFPATGFARSSYVIEGDMQLVPPDRLGKLRGSLTGSIRERFAEWAGM